MKTERRHELHHNVLADALENTAESLKPYAQLILGGLLAIAVVFGVYTYWSNRSQADLAHSWNSYLQASSTENIDDLRKVAEDHAGTPAAVWANLDLGDRALREGMDKLFTNRADAFDDLKKGEGYYLAAREATREPILGQRATLGLARVYESLVKLDKAKEEYARLKEHWPDSVYGPLAERRLADLQQQSTREFYDWFAAHEPKSPLGGPLGTPGTRPPFEPPSEPDLGGSLLDELNKTSKSAAPAADGEIRLSPPLLNSESSPPANSPNTPPATEKRADTTEVPKQP